MYKHTHTYLYKHEHVQFMTCKEMFNWIQDTTFNTLPIIYILRHRSSIKQIQQIHLTERREKRIRSNQWHILWVSFAVINTCDLVASQNVAIMKESNDEADKLVSTSILKSTEEDALIYHRNSQYKNRTKRNTFGKMITQWLYSKFFFLHFFFILFFFKLTKFHFTSKSNKEMEKKT